jgi:hypothetical protein
MEFKVGDIVRYVGRFSTWAACMTSMEVVGIIKDDWGTNVRIRAKGCTVPVRFASDTIFTASARSLERAARTPLEQINNLVKAHHKSLQIGE